MNRREPVRRIVVGQAVAPTSRADGHVPIRTVLDVSGVSPPVVPEAGNAACGSTGRGALNTDPLRHHRGHRGKGPFGEGLVARLAEKVADIMGSVQFVVASTVVILAWILVNHGVQFLVTSWHGLLNGHGFDPAPFILLNLVFSAVAYYSASMVMIAQKTQARRDQAHEKADAEHREELAGMQAELIRQNTRLTEDVHHLTQQIHALICKPADAAAPVPNDPDHPGR